MQVDSWLVKDTDTEILSGDTVLVGGRELGWIFVQYRISLRTTKAVTVCRNPAFPPQLRARGLVLQLYSPATTSIPCM